MQRVIMISTFFIGLVFILGMGSGGIHEFSLCGGACGGIAPPNPANCPGATQPVRVPVNPGTLGEGCCSWTCNQTTGVWEGPVYERNKCDNLGVSDADTDLHY